MYTRNKSQGNYVKTYVGRRTSFSSLSLCLDSFGNFPDNRGEGSDFHWIQFRKPLISLGYLKPWRSFETSHILTYSFSLPEKSRIDAPIHKQKQLSDTCKVGSVVILRGGACNKYGVIVLLLSTRKRE